MFTSSFEVYSYVWITNFVLCNLNVDHKSGTSAMFTFANRTAVAFEALQL